MAKKGIYRYKRGRDASYGRADARRIDGHLFTWFHTMPKKADATKYANKFRKLGYNARVTKHKDGGKNYYDVWATHYKRKK